MRIRPPTAPILLAASVLLVAGCGSDSGPLSREQLVEEANGICREQTERFQQIQAIPPANAHDAVGQTGKLIAVSEDSLQRFEELDAPEEDEARLEDYVDARRGALELLRQGRDAAERQDRRAYSAALDRALDQTRRRRMLARGLGFTECAGREPTDVR